MKKIILVLSICLIQSCTYSDVNELNNNSLSPISDQISLNPKVESAYLEFINLINCDDCIYTIYINEILTDSVIYTFQAESYYNSYFMKHRPLLLYKLNGKEIYIYAGIESTFKDRVNTKHLKKDSETKKYFMWTVISKNDSFEIDKKSDIPPFSRVVKSPFAAEMKEKYGVDSLK